jgi:competence protein ComEA
MLSRKTLPQNAIAGLSSPNYLASITAIMRPDPNHHYLSFTRKERIGILSLLFLILIVFLLPMFFNRDPRLPDPKAIDQFRAALSGLEIQDTEDSASQDGYDLHKVARAGKNVAAAASDKTSFQKNILFDFDPNEISAEGWKNLGLRDRTIQTIQRYRSKGAVFRQPADLQKIYGFKKEEYDRLFPFIKIHREDKKQYPSSRGIDTGSKATSPPAKDEARASYKKTASQILDINAADSTAFISLRGIGPVLASRIIRFREKLGGFYSVDQIGETFGLADSVFQKIKPYLNIHTDSLKKIDVNNADVNQLKMHPYIGWKLARKIVQYRQQHGSFTKPEDLQQLSILTDVEFRKILPYLR